MSTLWIEVFWKTKRSDPYHYLGSGKVWRRHLKKYNVIPETSQIFSFDSLPEASKFALEFSQENKIVESKDGTEIIVRKRYNYHFCLSRMTARSPFRIKNLPSILLMS